MFGSWTFVYRWASFLVMAPVVGCLVGGAMCLQSLENPRPLPITFNQIAHTTPYGGWYSISACRVDYATKLITGGTSIGYALRDIHEPLTAPVKAFYLVAFPANAQQGIPNGIVKSMSATRRKKLLDAHVRFGPATFIVDATHIPDWRIGLLWILSGITIGALSQNWLAQKRRQGLI
jgi:hypothetical protein